ncbi:thioredoxin domain-containing protein [Haladaptatus sp. GCM10025707]|uniref:DsbA family protein n=1 Tax=unclassified Haladaptatus TaxID=2622732 RepID=UPI0023E7D1A4|nr:MULTISPECIES: thioredoxin domain-containing protein [unclassified Haladaptatus]
MHRRRFLAGTALTGVSAFAGCVGGVGDAGMEGTGPTTGKDGGSTSASEEPQYRALDALDAQPVLGSLDRDRLIVAYEDPSCPTCRRFEQNTLPELTSKHIDTGVVAFVYRGFPVIYPWGKPATQAMEATFARDEDAFWALTDHYYAEQPSFTTDNVLAKTEAFLSAETDLDAAAIVQDARDKAYDDAVQTDLDTGKAAGASATPTFFLFVDGEFQTTVRGAQDLRVFESALQL